MKKIYKVRLCQEFNTICIFLPFIRFRDELIGRAEYIYAESKDEAIKIYNNKHPYENLNDVIRPYYEVFQVLNRKNPGFKYSYDINENMTFEELKYYAPSDMLLEYCKDRLYPINVVVDGE